MDDSANQARIAGLAWQEAASEQRHAGCLSETDIAILVDALASEVDAQAAVPDPVDESVMLHLAECPRCRGAVAGVSHVLGSGRVQQALDRMTPTPPGEQIPTPRKARRWRRAGSVAAAAIILLFATGLMTQRVSPESDPVHRATTRGFELTPVAGNPLGTVDAVTNFSWSPVANASLYRVTVFDTDGSVLWEARTADTTVTPPPSVDIPVDAPVFWRVSARVGFDTWVGSSLVEFKVTRIP